jgi:FkbM family methyltransferase
MPFVGSTLLLVEPGLTGATGNVYVGLHEFEDMSFVLHCLREGDLFLDVGANVGTYTLLASGVRGADTIALEPLPRTHARLLANVRLNGLEERVRALQMGAGSEPGTLRFTRSLDTMNHVAVAGGSDTVEVPVTTLDAAVGSRTPALIKIDVEGFETKVFAGASSLLVRPELRAIIVELNGSGAKFGFDEAALQRVIEDAGFRPYVYAPFERSVVPRPSRYLSGNTLYLRDLAWVEERVRTAPQVRVLGVEF